MAGSSFFGEGGGGKSLQTYQQYFIFRGREMPRNAIGRNCDICQILHKLHYVIFSTELYISGESTPILLQSNSWSKKHGGFLTNYDAIWRNLTPFLWQRLKVVTASQAQYWARGCFHTPLDFLKDIFNFCSKFSHLSMRMIFMDFIWTFTFYSKMYKLFKISLALERNEELIKRWNVVNCDILEVTADRELDKIYDVSYETGIWKF